jgi:hypothetical protein
VAGWWGPRRFTLTTKSEVNADIRGMRRRNRPSFAPRRESTFVANRIQAIALSPRTHLLLLEYAKDLGLDGGAHLSEIVEEQRAAVNCDEEAVILPQVARERSALVTEKHGFHRRFGHGGPIDGDEALIPSRARRVDGLGDTLLSG